MMMDKSVDITDNALDALRQAVRSLMSEKRYAHTCAVERMVTRLCMLYCPAEIPELRAAALLHDITKEETLQNQLQLCESFGIMVAPGDILAPKTFHAKTAAEKIKRDFPDFATETVISSVRWHTTGHADMTLTEQLLYLADYIDDTRTFSDCVRLRELFWGENPEAMEWETRCSHLQDVLILSFDMTVTALIDDGVPISVDTIAARNHLLQKKQDTDALRRLHNLKN